MDVPLQPPLQPNKSVENEQAAAIVEVVPEQDPVVSVNEEVHEEESREAKEEVERDQEEHSPSLL